MAYQGKYAARSSRGRQHRSRRQINSRAVILALALILLSSAIVGTLAYLTDKTEGIVNTFVPSSVPNTPEEKIENNAKTSITIQNAGNINAYIRVKLVTYRVNDSGSHIGGAAAIPSFTLGDNWFEQGGYYYYKLPVAPGASTGDLIGTDSSIPLKKYTDADGGKQVIEVISESIQSIPTTTVASAWGVTVGTDGNLTQTGGNA